MEFFPKRNGVYEKNNCLTRRKYIITKKNCKTKAKENCKTKAICTMV